MRAEFKASFLKDIGKLKDSETRDWVKEAIEAFEKAKNLQNVSNIKKLKGGDNYYRVKIGEYRIGLTIQGDLGVFIRCLHRKDIYRYFP